MLGASFALGQVHSIPGPVVHQLVQFVREHPLAALGLRDGRLVVVRSSPRHRIGAARPYAEKNGNVKKSFEPSSHKPHSRWPQTISKCTCIFSYT